jgi:hypothetical protein
MKITLFPSDEMLLSMLFRMESTMVNTEMIAKIPMVIPSSDKNVLSLLLNNESSAN